MRTYCQKNFIPLRVYYENHGVYSISPTPKEFKLIAPIADGKSVFYNSNLYIFEYDGYCQIYQIDDDQINDLGRKQVIQNNESRGDIKRCGSRLWMALGNRGGIVAVDLIDPLDPVITMELPLEAQYPEVFAVNDSLLVIDGFDPDPNEISVLKYTPNGEFELFCNITIYGNYHRFSRHRKEP